MSEAKTLRVGILSEVHNLEPKEAMDIDSMFVLRQFLESPFEVKPGGTEVVPVLFDGPLVLEDGGELPTYSARVKEGILFSDGTAMTPAILTDCLRNTALLKPQAEVSLEGDRIVFRLKRPNARFDITLSHVECAVYRREGGALLGTGAFCLAAGSTPRDLRLKRNPHYRHTVPLDEVRFITFPVDSAGRPTALTQALQAGTVELSNVLPRDDITTLSGVRKSFHTGLSTAVLYLNTERQGLADSRVRQAIGYAIDRLAIASACYSNSLAFKANSLIPRGMAAARDGMTFDLERARELLGQPGVQVPEKLTLLEIWGPRPYLPHPPTVARELQRQIGALGIEVEVVETTSSKDFFSRVVAGQEDMTLSGWVADTLDPCDFLDSNLASERIPTWENLAVSSNHSRFRSAAMDEALARYRGDASEASLGAILDLLSQEVPLVPLMYGSAATIMSFKILNFQASPLGVFSLADLDLKS